MRSITYFGATNEGKTKVNSVESTLAVPEAEETMETEENDGLDLLSLPMSGRPKKRISEDQRSEEKSPPSLGALRSSCHRQSEAEQDKELDDEEI